MTAIIGRRVNKIATPSPSIGLMVRIDPVHYGLRMIIVKYNKGCPPQPLATSLYVGGQRAIFIPGSQLPEILGLCIPHIPTPSSQSSNISLDLTRKLCV